VVIWLVVRVSAALVPMVPTMWVTTAPVCSRTVAPP
jgi:hypothetical protein